ncbi:MAG: thioesterase family protein [Acidimicrobiia bacterium]|nr:thioesterase family protein [Acidimicrobiia bacterium]
MTSSEHQAVNGRNTAVGAEPSTTEVPVGDLLADTTPTAVAETPGRNRLELSPAWNVLYAFGGMTMATALRAAREAVDRPDLDLLSTTATYCAPVPDGPIVLDTRVLRSSKAAAQCTAELSVGTPAEVPIDADRRDPALHLTAVFGRRHETTVDFTDVAYPADVPDPEDCPEPGPRRVGATDGDTPETDPEEWFPRINFHEQVRWRPAVGHSPTERGWEPGPARYAAWMGFVREPRRADGTVDPIALCIPGDSLGPSIWQRLGPFGPDQPPFLVLSLEITLHVLAPTSSSWLLQDVRCHWAGEGYAVGTTHLWDDTRSLVAIAVQRARLRPFEPGTLTRR